MVVYMLATDPELYPERAAQAETDLKLSPDSFENSHFSVRLFRKGVACEYHKSPKGGGAVTKRTRLGYRK